MNHLRGLRFAERAFSVSSTRTRARFRDQYSEQLPDFVSGARHILGTANRSSLEEIAARPPSAR